MRSLLMAFTLAMPLTMTIMGFYYQKTKTAARTDKAKAARTATGKALLPGGVALFVLTLLGWWLLPLGDAVMALVAVGVQMITFMALAGWASSCGGKGK